MNTDALFEMAENCFSINPTATLQLQASFDFCRKGKFIRLDDLILLLISSSLFSKLTRFNFTKANIQKAQRLF